MRSLYIIITQMKMDTKPTGPIFSTQSRTVDRTHDKKSTPQLKCNGHRTWQRVLHPIVL